jgi:hypothetical protein
LQPKFRGNNLVVRTGSGGSLFAGVPSFSSASMEWAKSSSRQQQQHKWRISSSSSTSAALQEELIELPLSPGTK